MSANKKNKVAEGLQNLFSPSTSPQPETPDPQPAAKAESQPKPVKPSIPVPAPEPKAEPVPAAILNAEETVDGEEQLVVFTLDDEFYGLAISVVESIIKMQDITIVPHAHAYVEGVTNLRGTVLSVIDLRSRFGLARKEPTKDTRIVVVENSGTNIGLIVDAVTEVIHIPVSTIEPPSLFVASLDSAFITGIAKFTDRLITLLDLKKIFIGQEKGEKAPLSAV